MLVEVRDIPLTPGIFCGQEAAWGCCVHVLPLTLWLLFARPDFAFAIKAKRKDDSNHFQMPLCTLHLYFPLAAFCSGARCVKGEGGRTETSSSTVPHSTSKGGNAFKLFTQGEANARLGKIKAEAGRAGQAPPSVSASKGTGNLLGPLPPNCGVQRK